MSVAKYMAAARGGANVAAKSAGIPEAATITKRLARANPGSLEGLDAGKAAWIQNIGDGYRRRARRTGFVTQSGVSAFNPRARSIRMGSDYTKPDYSRVTTDQDLSRLL